MGVALVRFRQADDISDSSKGWVLTASCLGR